MAAAAKPTPDYSVKLVSREEVAEGTMAFHFEKPRGFDFKPGQYADMTLPDPPETDKEGNTRSFSIASPPFQNELIFTTRMRDTAFKHSLKTVPLSTEVNIGPATGDFTLHKDHATPAVFIAGGIGITPFLSIVRQADRDRPAQKLYLFYSNRRPEDTAFLDLLQKLDSNNPDFRLTCTMTEMEKSKKEWKGETELIDKKMLSKYLTSLEEPIYYIAGPPAMVKAMRKMLMTIGIEDSHVKVDEFEGY